MQLAHRKQRFGELRLVQPVQKIALVFGRVQALEQLMLTRGLVEAHPGVMAGGDFLGPQAHGVVQKGLELDFGVAQDVGVGRAPAAVFAQEFGKHPVLVLCGKVDVLDLDADHVRHGGCVNKIDVRGAVLRIVVVFPVFHEDADDLVALLFKQPGGDRRVHAAAQTHHHPLSVVLLVHARDYPRRAPRFGVFGAWSSRFGG